MFEGMTVVSGVVVLVGAVSGVAASLHEAAAPAGGGTAGTAGVVRAAGEGGAAEYGVDSGRVASEGVDSGRTGAGSAL